MDSSGLGKPGDRWRAVHPQPEPAPGPAPEPPPLTGGPSPAPGGTPAPDLPLSPDPVTIEAGGAADPAAPADPAARAARQEPVWRDHVLADAIVPTIVLHVGIFIAGFVLVMVFRPENLTVDPFGIWAHWDAPHFFEIARFGYGPPADPARIVLFPFFPGLIAIGALVTSPLAAGMIVSFATTLLAAVAVYRLAREDYGRRTARASIVALNLFPTAFTFVAPYSEAPFLAFVAWSLVRAREDDWRGAGAFALLASVTRLQGAFLIPALGIEYLVRHRRLGPELKWLAMALLGPLIYLGINVVTFGNPLKFIEVQRTVFHVQNINPIDALKGLVTGVLKPGWNESWLTVYVAPLAAEILLAVVVIWACRSFRRRPADATYALLTLVSLATLSWPISLPRYVLGIPGLFVFVGRGLARRALAPYVVALLTMLLTVCLTLFVIGHWAF